jgi:hypothetical protein
MWKIAVYATIAGLAVEVIYMLLTEQTSVVAALCQDVMRGVGWGVGLWLCPAAANAFCSARSLSQ